MPAEPVPLLRVVADDAASAGAPVRVQNLSVAFSANRVLDALDLDIAAGGFVAIVGRSGCGKSTLLRAITGLIQPSGGGVDLNPREARLVFQEPRLLPWATAAQNVAVGAPPSAGAARPGIIADRLAEVGLSDKADAWPSELSGGQRQRVALARALASRPRLLALDEPLGALDALTRIDMQALLARVWAAERFTTLLVTHDVAEAVFLADRVVVLEGGRVSLDVAIPVARPRRHGDAALAALEGRILDRLLRR